MAEASKRGQAPARPLLLKVPDAAKALSVGLTKMYELINAQEIRSIRVGPNAVRVPVAEIEAYIARKLAETAPEAGAA